MSIPDRLTRLEHAVRTRDFSCAACGQPVSRNQGVDVIDDDGREHVLHPCPACGRDAMTGREVVVELPPGAMPSTAPRPTDQSPEQSP